MTRILIVLALGASACLGPRQVAGGAVTSGQPLAVVDNVHYYVTTYKEKVGEAVYRDANGAAVGSASIYRTHAQLNANHTWVPFQGGQQIRDEDFFRIAGDPTSADMTEHMRSSGKVWVVAGVLTMIAGGVALAAGLQETQDVQKHAYLSYGGIGGLVIGGSIGAYGWGQQNPEHHAVDRSIADMDAARYNAQLGRALGASVSGQF